MKKSRMLGNYVEYLAKKQNVSHETLCEVINCDENKLQLFLKGHLYLSFEQMSKLAKTLNTTVKDMLKGNQSVYDETIVSPVNKFTDTDNREKILDLIDNYIDIENALKN